MHVNVPDLDHQASREAIVNAMVNAFCHRDYTRIGSIRFMIDAGGLTISNPGGLIEGINEDNLLARTAQIAQSPTGLDSANRRINRTDRARSE